jgi:Leucine-rich repeat (LRR) protein
MASDAVPPSSPPPHATSDITYTSSSPFFESRYNAHSLKSSSPPPLFSSDDSRESADLGNYESPRIFKNKRKGAWWNNESAHSPLKFKKAKMTRNYDSGVYMMSDGTDSSESLPPHKAPFGLDGTSDEPPEEDPLLPEMGAAENLFCTKLYAGLDKNSQTYDFGGCYFLDSDIRRIGELKSVIKSVPDPGVQLPAEGQYRSMVPELYVNLSDNHLRFLTPSLFNVQNLTTLNLVNNDIEELPPDIGRLHNLRELNISRNPIQWLPYELLELFKKGNLEILGDSGVPWLMPNVEQLRGRSSIFAGATNLVIDAEEEYKDIEARPDRKHFVWQMRLSELMVIHPEDSIDTSRRNSYGEESIGFSWSDWVSGQLHNHKFPSHYPSRYVARTPVTYFNQEGALIKGSPKSSSSADVDFAVITETTRGAHGVPASWFTPPHMKPTKSLSTLALECALAHKDQDGLTVADLRGYLGDPAPPVAKALLEQAERNNSGGYGEFRSCHVCKKQYVMARAEWIEWWRTQTQVVLPFKIQACSWGCVPEALLQRPEKELDW